MAKEAGGKAGVKFWLVLKLRPVDAAGGVIELSDDLGG